MLLAFGTALEEVTEHEGPLLIGGRSMGMYTAVSGTDDWMRRFGIDVEEIDQFELVRRAEKADPAEAERGRLWLEEKNIGVVILLVLCLFPLPGSFLLRIVDALGLVFVRLWG